MDALTWFKSVFQRALATPAPPRVDMATEQWADVPLHLAAARLRPRLADADGDEDWDEVIARAKIQAASPKVPSVPPPFPPPHPSPKAPSPPPFPAPQPSPKAPSPPAPPPPRRASPAELRAPRANPDVIVWGGPKKS